MKWIMIFGTIVTTFIITPAFAAGKMEQVSQNIDVSNATIVTKPGSIGAGGSVEIFGKPLIDGGKQAGEITIGKISNNGGTIKDVSQVIKGNNAKIISEGAPITIGEIINK